MKKLAYFCHGLSANGIESFIVNVLGRIDKSKYDISVVIAIDEGVESLHEPQVLDWGIRVIHAGDLDSTGKKLQYFKNIRKILHENKFDVVHANMDMMNGIILRFAKEAGTKIRICHAHTSGSQYKPEGRLAELKIFVQKTYHKVMKSLIINNSTHRVACSDAAQEYFYGNKDAITVYNGIDIQRFEEAKASTDRQKELASLNINDNPEKTIVSVGRISMPKNPLFAVDVINELKKIRTDFKYIWVGVGDLEDEMKAKIEQKKLEDVIVLAGLRTDIPQVLSCCDVFLMTSIFEGLPFSLVEAQASGLKCVVSDVVSTDADIGLLEYISLEKTPKEWAELISKKLDEPAALADDNKKTKFDISYTVNQLEKIYDAE